MTQEEKAKRYCEALSKARDLYRPSNSALLEEIFPELIKYNDEKIRGAIIHFISHTPTIPKGVINKETMIAWLEKQSEQKVNYTTLVETGNGGINALVTREVSANDYEEKPANKVEPKFHESEWITNGDYTWKIVEVKPLDYILQSQDGNIVDDSISHVDEQFHSFTIKDAKDGDVLFHSDSASNGIFIFKEIIDKGFAKEVICYCDYDSEDHFCLGEHHTCCWTDAKILYPATKEQRDALMKAMTDAGYTFDFDKKELKKSNSYCQKHCKGFQETDKCFADGDYKDKREAEQNPAWSEEDEEIMSGLLSFLLINNSDQWAKYGKWLKELKERIGG